MSNHYYCDLPLIELFSEVNTFIKSTRMVHTKCIRIKMVLNLLIDVH